MITADFLSNAANVTLFLILVRLVQTHFAIDANSTLGSALAFIFH